MSWLLIALTFAALWLLWRGLHALFDLIGYGKKPIHVVYVWDGECATLYANGKRIDGEEPFPGAWPL